MADTIYAVASGSVPSAIAVIRISGQQAAEIAVEMVGALPKERQSTLRTIVHPATGRILDRGIVLWFPGPHSYTGEDYLEFQVHGSRAVLGAISGVLSERSNVRLAEPGEFSMRALLNGKTDLASLEGLADLIQSETEFQRQQSIRVASGYLTNLVEGWRQSLISALAIVEASLDFVDEHDVPKETTSIVFGYVQSLIAQFKAAIADSRRAEIIRDGFMVAIVGPPNVGKSTLLNAIVRRDAAIVTDIPGTTRDAIEVRIALGGHEIRFVDTAGIRETDNLVEAEGIKRTLRALDEADLVLSLTNPRLDSSPIYFSIDLKERIFEVETKADLGASPGKAADFSISALTGNGVSELLDGVLARVRAATAGDELPLVTRVRHRRQIERALEDLESLSNLPSLSNQPELISEFLRSAIFSLDTLLGRVDVEDVLGEVFSRFCIGK